MKKIVIIFLLFSLIIPFAINAETQNEGLNPPRERIYNLVGKVEAINSQEKSFDLRLERGLTSKIRGFFASVFSVFSKRYSLPVYKIITDEQTTFQKKTTSGVVSGSFSDLAIGLKVQVKGTLSAPTNEQYLGIIRAKNVFILTPPSAITSPSLEPQCTSNNDCIWCGSHCFPKSKPMSGCSNVPPSGAYCKCDNGVCIPVLPPTTTASTSTPPTPSVAPECTIDNNCAWCGNSCMLKSRIPIGGNCPDVQPEPGVICKCQNGKCKKIKSSFQFIPQ